jgi:glutathione S-transferase
VDGEDNCPVRGGVASVHFELIDAETHAARPLVDGALSFPQYAGKVGASDATAAEKAKAQKAAAGAVGETLAAFHKFKTFVGGDHVSIADIRLACSLEFLKVIDYHFPEWAKTYMGAVAKALGEAYAEPRRTSRATSLM